MPLFTLMQITTCRRHVEIEADTLEQAIEKAEADTDLVYSGCATPDWDTKFKPDLKWNKK